MKSSLLLTAALMASHSTLPWAGAMTNAASPASQRPRVKRIVGSTDAEIKAWNQAVDAKKRAKKVAK